MFKNLSFILKDIDYEFVLSYKDLFIQKENEYIFSIAFDIQKESKDTYWILGNPFMKKYQLVYDLDRKIIGLYKDNIINNKRNSSFNIYIFMVIILILVIIGLTIYIYYLKKPRKNKAFELDDENYDYNPTN